MAVAERSHSAVSTFACAEINGEDELGASQRRQDRRVCCIRGILVLALIATAVVVATFAGWYVSSDEHEDFVLQYTDSYEVVQEAFQIRLDVKRDSAMVLSAMFTSRYGPLGAFPNVTTPNFEEQTKGLLLISDCRALSFNPVITQDVDRLQWEAHASESAWLLGEPVALLGNETWPDNRTVSFGIYSRDESKTVVYDPGYEPDSEAYSNILVPVWQIAPYETNERAVMFNLHSEINRMQALDNMMKYGVPSLTAILQLVQDKDEIRPSAILFYPVFDSFESTPDGERERGKVVGSVSLVFSWDTFLASILPDYIKGLVCVLSASTGQVYSYTIRGDDVEFMGEGDLHDPNYDEYQEQVEARLLLEGDEDAGKFIIYTLTLYPSEEFEAQYKTKKPAVYASGAVLIFFFTAAIFLLYDHLVEDRQERTSRLARQSGNIVEAMFPPAFRERLYKVHGNADQQRRLSQRSRRDSDSSRAGVEEESSSATKTEIVGSSVNSVASSIYPIRRTSQIGTSVRKKVTLKSIDTFMKGLQSTNQFDPQFSREEEGVLEGEPIAELFHNTSIMFSDIVGFTQWSSEHSPNEVFKLLEQIFWEFDEIAGRLNVFKLGTIGDCYIAVTGIPDAVQDHATLLTQFAFEARDKVREVCARLESDGLDTARLDMRFGIHSGDTTAGILRGAKPRFELFGDTINTASRMESTGLPGKIQVSQETAKLIQGDKKSQWLTKRDTKITAKGKGELQTYWAEPNRRVSFSDNTALTQSLRGSIARLSISEWSEGSPEIDGPDEPRNSNSQGGSLTELMGETVDRGENESDRDIDSIQIDLDPEEFDPIFVRLMSKKDLSKGPSKDGNVDFSIN